MREVIFNSPASTSKKAMVHALAEMFGGASGSEPRPVVTPYRAHRIEPDNVARQAAAQAKRERIEQARRRQEGVGR